MKFKPYRRKLRLTVTQILRWADAHHARTGQWPKNKPIPVKESPEDGWQAIDGALRAGVRGLPGGTSLARLLEEHRGARNRAHLPPLSIRQILSWADAHHKRTGRWPRKRSGPVMEAPQETWETITNSLEGGRRGLPGGSSLPRLLSEHRGVRNPSDLPRLTIRQILAWADAHHQRTGAWPRTISGPVPEEPGTTWALIDSDLMLGSRGLPGRTTLARLLAKYRRVGARWWRKKIQILGHARKKQLRAPKLTIRQILGWADKHHERTGRWPNADSGVVRSARQENWPAIDTALRMGFRGLPGGSSLARLLSEHRGVRNSGSLPDLTIRQILAWADEHRRRYKEWPNRLSGPIRGAPGENWSNLDSAMIRGYRGLPRRLTLARLLAEQRGLRNRWSMGRLTVGQILTWADAHHQRTGQWPMAKSGPVKDAPGESWRAINIALSRGLRGLPRGNSLSQLLVRYHRRNKN